MRLAMLTTICALLAMPALAQQPQDLNAAEAALATAWEAAPLTLGKPQLVESVSGFGAYTARAGNVFKPGEPIVVYLEPRAFGYRPAGEGTYEFGLRFDLKIINALSQTLSDTKGIAEVTQKSHAMNREFPVTVRLNLKQALPGDYVLEYLAHDIASDKTATFSLPITIAQ